MERKTKIELSNVEWSPRMVADIHHFRWKDCDFTRKSRFIRRACYHTAIWMVPICQCDCCAVDQICWLLGRRFSVNEYRTALCIRNICFFFQMIFFRWNRFISVSWRFSFSFSKVGMGEHDVRHWRQWQPPTTFISICSIA